MKKFAKFAIVALIMAFMLSTNAKSNEPSGTGQVTDTVILTETNDTLHEMRVNACKEYMEWVFKNQGKSFSSAKLSPEAIVSVCEEHSISIPFVMAVANLESCFGMTSRAKRTNSVFSVGLFDNGKNMKSYASQDESVAAFVKLIKEDYLYGEKTVEDLLKTGCFVNKYGMRYAMSQNYERNICSIMRRIVKKHPILESF